jgi:mono/diheme cytochrome c family protein
MRTTMLAAAVVALAAILLRAEAQAPSRVSDWIAPSSEAARVNPLSGQSSAVAGGSKLFHERCTACHGDDARGTPRAPGLTKASVQIQSDGALFWKISSGNTRRGMPPYSFLPRAQRWQLVMFLRAQAAAPHAAMSKH